jgi:hypothetical protein
MTSALAFMDLCEQVAALFLGDAPHEDPVGTTAVEIPFYHRVPLSHSDYALNRCLVFRKEIIFQVVSDLRDPCTRAEEQGKAGPAWPMRGKRKTGERRPEGMSGPAERKKRGGVMGLGLVSFLLLSFSFSIL